MLGIPKSGIQPRGYVDGYDAPAGKIHVVGWAIDDDTPDQAVEVHVYVGGRAGEPGSVGYNIGPANVQREAAVGRHGFDATFDTDLSGSRQMYIYLLDTDGNVNTELGPYDVSIPMPGEARCIPDGNYLIASAACPDKTTHYYMDISGTEVPAANRTNVSLCGPSNAYPASDIWNVTYADGFYTIRQLGSEMALDLFDANLSEGANIGVCADNGTDAQKWAISHNGENGYRIRSKASGYSVDIEGKAAANNANISVKYRDSSETQSWLFIPYEPAQTLASGRYILLSGVDSHVELDVPGDTGNVDDGVHLQVWSDTAPSRYNSFDVTKLDGGYYSIIHAASGKAMEVTYGPSNPGEPVSLMEANGSNAQQWAVTPDGDGSYTLRVRTSGYLMDLLNSSTSNGSPVVQNLYNNSASEKWRFVKAEYAVKYNANGGTNAPAQQVKYYNEDLALSTSLPERPGYEFLGWAKGSAGSGEVYGAGGTYSENKDITFYALWERLEADLVLPASTVTVEEEAFRGGAFVYVSLPEGTREIGSRAFADCPNLRYIYIPEGTTRIAADAFEGVNGLTVLGKQGSYAEYYAQNHGFSFRSQ